MIPSEITPVRPYSPATELLLDDEDQEESDSFTLDNIDDSAETRDEIKINEVSAKTAEAAPTGAPDVVAITPEAEKKKEKPEEPDSLNSLFSDDEEEENPLASLINSLPDVTVQELMDNLAEIQQIIKEWKPSPK